MGNLGAFDQGSFLGGGSQGEEKQRHQVEVSMVCREQESLKLR